MLLKTVPEDFLVREYANLGLGSGPHSIYLLRKRDWNTEDCIQWLVEKKQIRRKDVGVCGNKDKQAVTEQHISIRNGPPLLTTPPEWTLTFLGTRSEQLRMGEHERNFFVITVRGVTSTPVRNAAVRNLYGEQRFGQNNVAVGLALLRKQYGEACTLLGLEYNTDPIGALRRVPKHTLLLYVHAVQSLLWNELAQQLPKQQTDVPIIGFGPSGNTGLLPAYAPLLHKYGLTDDAWINRSFPELSVEGGSRPLLQDLQDVSVSSVSAGSCTLCFSLGKGSYATETMRQLCANNSDP